MAKRGRTVVRIASLAVATLLGLQFVPELDTSLGSVRAGAILYPAISPFAVACGAVAGRFAGWIALLGLPVLLIALVRGRWFCRWLCPAGLVIERIWKMRLGRIHTPWARTGGKVLVVTAFAAAVLGSGIFIWLDPLAMFNGFVSAFHFPLQGAAFLAAIPFVITLIASAVAPTSWCYGVCPLGAIQDLAAQAGHAVLKRGDAHTQTGVRVNEGRRAFLAAGAGVTIGCALRVIPGSSHAGNAAIRPPGALPDDRFEAACERCGNCVRACPTRIIRPDTTPVSIGAALAPEIVIDDGVPGRPAESAYCREFCNACTEVCPTGAIRIMSLEEKSRVCIGIAVVDRKHCIAWARAARCVVCHEFCPYQAVQLVESYGVNCPEVIADLCRGCGLCQVQCPTLDGKAIVVRARPQEQARLAVPDETA